MGLTGILGKRSFRRDSTEEPIDEDFAKRQNNASPKPTRHEIHVIGDEGEADTIHRGSGTATDPITILEWTRPKVNDNADEEIINLISDDERREGRAPYSPVGIYSDREEDASEMKPSTNTPIAYESDDSLAGTPPYKPLYDGLFYSPSICSADDHDDMHSQRTSSISIDDDVKSLGSDMSKPACLLEDFGNEDTDAEDDDRISINYPGRLTSFTRASPSTLYRNYPKCTSPSPSPTPSTSKSRPCTPESTPTQANDGVLLIDLDIDGEDEETMYARIRKEIPVWVKLLQSQPQPIKAEPIDDERREARTSQTLCSSDINHCHNDNGVLSTPPPSQDTATISEHLKLSTGMQALFDECSSIILKSKDLKQIAKETTKSKKIIFLHLAPSSPSILTKLRATVRNIMAKHVEIPITNPESSCWIHQEKGTRRFKQTLSTTITFHYKGEKLSLTQNFGIIQMIVQNKLTPELIHGLVTEQWHVSHLCGNWRCVNVEHIILEPGPINQSRNACFRGKERPVCKHVPRCLTELTQPLWEGDGVRGLRLKEAGQRGGIDKEERADSEL